MYDALHATTSGRKTAAGCPEWTFNTELAFEGDCRPGLNAGRMGRSTTRARLGGGDDRSAEKYRQAVPPLHERTPLEMASRGYGRVLILAEVQPICSLNDATEANLRAPIRRLLNGPLLRLG